MPLSPSNEFRTYTNARSKIQKPSGVGAWEEEYIGTITRDMRLVKWFAEIGIEIYAAIVRSIWISE
jgi:hypothetical protein